MVLKHLDCELQPSQASPAKSSGKYKSCALVLLANMLVDLTAKQLVLNKGNRPHVLVVLIEEMSSKL